VKGCLRIALPIVILAVLAIYCAFPHPLSNQTKLKAIAAEAQQLMAAYPVSPAGESVEVPRDKWPPTIASLKPWAVFVHQGMVDIPTILSFDGGWGYGFATDKRNLTMLVECWSELGHSVYWHGPC
jgi:hypothetical protein